MKLEMSLRAGSLLFIIASIFLLADSCSAAQAVEKYILVLENAEGKNLYSVPVHEGSEFAIRFIHSVARSPVTDYFIIKEGKVVLDKTTYHDFGAGLPHNPEKGQEMKSENGEISITGFNREIPELALRVGRVADHSLLVFGKEGSSGIPVADIPLANLSPPGSVIIFHVHSAKAE